MPPLLALIDKGGPTSGSNLPARQDCALLAVVPSLSKMVSAFSGSQMHTWRITGEV
jgi:hypothetical protein